VSRSSGTRERRSTTSALFRYAFARHQLLALVSSPLADATQSNALLAVNDAGWILGATSAALMQLVLRAAEALGISRSTLHRKIKKYGLSEA
jgi:transcriptional regulator of acetoin/glycerol metabolism